MHLFPNYTRSYDYQKGSSSLNKHILDPRYVAIDILDHFAYYRVASLTLIVESNPIMSFLLCIRFDYARYGPPHSVHNRSSYV